MIELNPEEASAARDEGIAKAVAHANSKSPGWADRAYAFLSSYCAEMKDVFLVEDVRKAAEGVIDNPPKECAWGGVIVRARNAGLIEGAGLQKTKNKQAHRRPAYAWRSI